MQRLYWSRAINPGTAWTNASHYENPEVDAIIEQTQREADPERRAELFREFQHLVQADLPAIPLVELRFFTVHDQRLRDAVVGPDAAYASLKHAWLADA